jgi:hypothetical protein
VKTREILTAFSTAFRAGVEQRGALLVVARGEPVERLRDRDVALVRRDHEAGVRERLDLRLHGGDDARRAVAHGGDGDARAQVDQGVAVDVDDDTACCPRGEDRHRGADPGGDGGGLARHQLLRDGSGQRRAQAPLLGDAVDDRSSGGRGGIGDGQADSSAGVVPSSVRGTCLCCPMPIRCSGHAART